MNNQWRGVRKTATALLSQRDYHVQSFSARLAGEGVEAAELVKADRANPEVATAWMFSGTAKGFHMHPPFVPEGEEPEKWFQRLFVLNPGDVQARPYDREQ